MANFSVSPQGLRFNSAPVQGSISGLYATPQTLSFTLTNTSGASVTVTNYGFSSSTEGDAVTQPAGVLYNSDFTVAVHLGAFPVTITNGSSQQFDVTYAPLRRGSGFGDIRSALLVLFSGYKVLSNGGSVFNSMGELVNETLPQLVTVGVGGPVTEEAYDWPSSHPIGWTSGSNNDMSIAGTGEVSYVQGVRPIMTIADLDTGRHSLSAIELYAGTSAGSTAMPSGVRVGARGVQVLVYGLDTETTLDLTIYVVTSGGNVAVGIWTAATGTQLNYKNIGGLFLGNSEGLDLQGLPLYATVSNVTNPNNVTIKIGVVVTG